MRLLPPVFLVSRALCPQRHVGPRSAGSPDRAALYSAGFITGPSLILLILIILLLRAPGSVHLNARARTDR